MARNTDHIVGVAGTKKMKCLHCGSQLEIPMPIEISVFIAMGKAFIKKHKNCPPPEKVRTKVMIGGTTITIKDLIADDEARASR